MKSMLRALAHAWTRRRFLAAGVATAAFSADDRLIPSERVRFADSITEFEISRVTTPTHTSLLPPPFVRMFSRRTPVSLLFASDHGGTMQAYLLDIKTWQSRLLTEASALDPASLCLSPDDRLLCYRDGQTLRVLVIGTTRHREVYRWPDDAAGSAVQVLPEGPSALIVETKNVLKLVNLVRGDARKVCDYSEPILDPMPRPRRASVAFRTASGGLALAHLDGSRTAALKTAAGAVGPARWSPDGRGILYLHFPEAGAKTSHLREINPDTGEDRLVAATSQFAQFSPNGDASVFVGASTSLAQPHVLLLLRSVRRELTLCEHRSSTATPVTPVFSPDSQRIFFQSDRQGKPAIYAMAVERLVEKTEAQ